MAWRTSAREQREPERERHRQHERRRGRDEHGFVLAHDDVDAPDVTLREVQTERGREPVDRRDERTRGTRIVRDVAAMLDAERRGGIGVMRARDGDAEVVVDEDDDEIGADVSRCGDPRGVDRARLAARPG